MGGSQQRGRARLSLPAAGGGGGAHRVPQQLAAPLLGQRRHPGVDVDQRVVHRDALEGCSCA